MMVLWIFSREMCSACQEAKAIDYPVETLEVDLTPENLTADALRLVAWAEVADEVERALPVLVLWGRDMRYPLKTWSGRAPKVEEIQEEVDRVKSGSGEDRVREFLHVISNSRSN